MNILQVEFATPEYDETIALRYKILREPLGLEFTEEQLAAEYTDFHFAAYSDAWILRGCLVLTPKNDKVLKMRQVAVSIESQSKGIGTLLVQMSEVFAHAKGYETMELNARDTAIPFYEKLNYKKVGEEFVEINIPHYKMVKSLL